MKEPLKKLSDGSRRGTDHREIAGRLNVGVATVAKVRKMREINRPKNKACRKTILTEAVQRRIVRHITCGGCDNAVQVTRELSRNDNINVSAEAVRKILRKHDFHGRSKMKKPLLKKRHRQARLRFAKKYRHLTTEDWARVIWSDETKINRVGSDGRQWTWKKPNEPLQDRHIRQTLKFGGGNIMLWGCMMSKGVGQCRRIVGRMTADAYISILEDGLLGSLHQWRQDVADVIFQQDNDPKHTARVTKEWLQNQGFHLLDWPAQSPDLNPIEHLWVEVKRSVTSTSQEIRTLDDLWSHTQESWVNIPPSVCQNLVDSMPRRIEAVIKAKGGHTKY